MTAVLHDCVETSTLGEDELRSWEQLLSPVAGFCPDGRELAVCPGVVAEEIIAVKHGDGIHVLVAGILNVHLG